MLMRMQSRCAHQLRPPLTSIRGPSVRTKVSVRPGRSETKRPLAIGKPCATTRELAFVKRHFRRSGLTESQYAASERGSDEWSPKSRAARSHGGAQVLALVRERAALWPWHRSSTAAVALERRNDSAVMRALDARRWQRKNGVAWRWSETPRQRRSET